MAKKSGRRWVSSRVEFERTELILKLGRYAGLVFLTAERGVQSAGRMLPATTGLLVDAGR